MSGFHSLRAPIILDEHPAGSWSYDAVSAHISLCYHELIVTLACVFVRTLFYPFPHILPRGASLARDFLVHVFGYLYFPVLPIPKHAKTHGHPRSAVNTSLYADIRKKVSGAERQTHPVR